ncbi:MAG: hypothetical protein HZB23_12945 [Deltaproteobacteria bacterium]|nr:hypothetical protein [Deltaproteobacteria bacterium]
MKRKIALITLVSMLLGVGICLAQAPDARWWNNPDAAGRLSITAADKSRLEALYAQSQRKMIDLKSAVAKERLDLDAALNNPKSTDAALKERYQSLTRAQNALAQERFNFIIQTRQVLGHERFAIFKTMFEERRHERMNKWRERRSREGAAGQGPQTRGGDPSLWGE